MNKSGDRLFWLGLVILSFIGGALVFFMSGPFGLGLTTDSICYMQGAKHLLLGQGIASYNDAGRLAPMGWYPPGFSIALSVAWFLGFSFLEWARILNASLFSVSIFIMGALVFYVTRTRWSALVAAGALLASVHILEVHGKFLAEPLFLSLLMLCLAALLFFINTGSRRSLYIAALVAGLSATVRFTGIPLISVAFIWLLIYGNKDNRIKDALRFGLVASILPLILFVRSNVLGCAMQAGVPDLFSQWHEQVYFLIKAFSEWLLPARLPTLLRAAFLGVSLVTAGLWFKGNWHQLRTEVQRALCLVLVFVGVYLAGSVWVMFFTKTNFFLDSRQLTPVYIVALLALGLVLPAICYQLTTVRKVFVVVLAGLFIVALARSAQLTTVFYKNGYGYSSKKMTSSKLAETLRSIDDSVPLYSNDVEAVYYFTGRPAVKIPGAGQDVSFCPASLATDFVDRRGVAVIFDPGTGFESKAWARMKDAVGLQVLLKDKAGDIYGVRKR